MMRVLVLHQHYWPEIAAIAQLLGDVCEDLAAAGHEVHVVAGQPSYRGTGRDVELAAYEVHRGVHVHRVASHRPAVRSIPQRLAAYGSYFATSLGRAVSMARPDVALVVSTPPLLLGVSGVLLHALRGVPFVYCVQDLYPDIAVHLGVLRPGPLTSAIDLSARSLYRAARRVITISESMAIGLVRKGVPPDRIDVIHNWADTSSLRVMPRDNGFARANGLAEPFVVQYSGNVGRSQGLEHLPEAARQVSDLPVKFAVVGDGDARASLESAVRDAGLRNVAFFPPVPREDLSALLASCDVGLVTMRRDVGADLLPSKLYGIMASSRPVLAAVAAESEVARVVTEHRCGVVVDPESAKALAAGVRDVWARQAELPDLGSAGRVACEQHFSRGVAASLYERSLSLAAWPSRAAARTA